MICRLQSFLAQVLKVKYFPSTSFMQAEVWKSMSYKMEEYAKRAATVNKRPVFSGGEWLIEGLEKQASGSDSGAKRGILWCKLWSAQVPPKVHMHSWRLAKGILPTRAALTKKKVQLLDVECVFCSNSVKDSLHMLSAETLEAFLMALLVSWVERNNMVWRGKYYNTANMFEWSTTLVKEYKQCQLRNGSKKKRAKTKWSCPPRGRLKVNIDGSFV
ncbi:hypothetical protein ACLB2K_063692 [Fragaria x ananassa]